LAGSRASGRIPPDSDPELLVQAQQVLLDRRLGDDQVGRDLACGGRGHEGIVGQRGPAQGG